MTPPTDPSRAVQEILIAANLAHRTICTWQNDDLFISTHYDYLDNALRNISDLIEKHHKNKAANLSYASQKALQLPITSCQVDHAWPLNRILSVKQLPLTEQEIQKSIKYVVWCPLVLLTKEEHSEITNSDRHLKNEVNFNYPLRRLEGIQIFKNNIDVSEQVHLYNWTLNDHVTYLSQRNMIFSKLAQQLSC